MKVKRMTCSLLITQDCAGKIYERRFGELLEEVEKSDHCVCSLWKPSETNELTTRVVGRNSACLGKSKEPPPVRWKLCGEACRGAMNAEGSGKKQWKEKWSKCQGPAGTSSLRNPERPVGDSQEPQRPSLHNPFFGHPLYLDQHAFYVGIYSFQYS